MNRFLSRLCTLRIKLQILFGNRFAWGAVQKNKLLNGIAFRNFLAHNPTHAVTNQNCFCANCCKALAYIPHIIFNNCLPQFSMATA